MTNKKKIIIAILVFLIAIISSVIYYINYNPYKGINLDSVYSLVKIQYFDKGKYDDYKALFTTPNNALSQVQFDDYRKSNKPNVMFKYDSDSPKSVMKHIKAVQDGKDTNIYRVYYLKDVNDTKEIEKASYWLVTKKDGKWMLKND